jgi:hypothetical protein
MGFLLMAKQRHEELGAEAETTCNARWQGATELADDCSREA